MEKLLPKILVCINKPCRYAMSQYYFPIQVGAGLSKNDLGVSRDDTGDNISGKNQSYCELTGVYWAWKNIHNSEIIGLNHYRRYFDFHKQGELLFPYSDISINDFDRINLSIPDKVIDKVSKGVVYVAKPLPRMYSNWSHYCCSHNSGDLKLLWKIIDETEPESIQKAFFKVFCQKNEYSAFNMFIMNRKHFDEYCSWLFPLLEKVESIIDVSTYNPYQRRVFGYMSERLMNVWLLANKIKTEYVPVIRFVDDEVMPVGFAGNIRYALKCFMYKISTKLSSPRDFNIWRSEQS